MDVLNACEATLDNPPDNIAGYKILAELGRGTTGIVYKAWHPRFNRTVALKLMHTAPEADREMRLARFCREIRLTVCCADPNIPPAYDAYDHKGQHFFVREFVDGETLEQGVQDGSIDFRKGLAILLEIAKTVERIDERGIAHRNLDPSNVLIAANGAVKLIGFGRGFFRSGSDPDPPDASVDCDVEALKQMLNWLCSVFGQSVPPRLAGFRSDDSLCAAREFAALLEGCLT